MAENSITTYRNTYRRIFFNELYQGLAPDDLQGRIERCSDKLNMDVRHLDHEDKKEYVGWLEGLVYELVAQEASAQRKKHL